MKVKDLCPLCASEQHVEFHQDHSKRSQRKYLRCNTCHLVFVPSEYYLSSDAERAEYDRHNNDMADDGYRQFLSRLWCQLQPKLKIGDHVLDFGCGPGPLLGKMMKEDGFNISLYDLFYQPDQAVLQQTYHAVSATEVIEHLHQPRQVFESWLGMLKPHGYLALMTKQVTDQAAFANWHYKNDLTHVCFFSRDSFNWLADEYELEVEFHGSDVIIFQKST